MNLARTLLEHVACMAWIAADPDGRFDIWLKKDYRSRLDYDKEAARQNRWERRGPVARGALSDEDRAAYRQHVRRVQADFPGQPKMFEQADEYWLPRYPAGLANHRAMSLVSLYTHVYDAYSWMSHPRLTGLQAFWDFQPQWTVVHAQERAGLEHDPLHMGQLLVGLGMLIAALGWASADPDEVVDVLNSNAELARHVREGKLVTVEVRPGHFRLAPPD